MKIKKLVWLNEATPYGESIGLFNITANIEILGLRYSIINRIPGEVSISKKYYLDGANQIGTTIVCKSIEKAKEWAQKHFEKTVNKLFFI
jgi:hypothetical protein